MGLGGGAYSGPKEVSYLFVDGGYLRSVVKRLGVEFFAGSEPAVDYNLLGAGFTKCFYYDCLPVARPGEEAASTERRRSRQRAQLSEIRSLRGSHVFEGVLTGEGSRARQKQVDVQIAVDLLTHSYRKNMHRATFIAGDQDFRPLVEAVVRDGMFIEIWFERTSASTDLLDAADGRAEVDLYKLHGFLTREFREANPLPRRWMGLQLDVGSAKRGRTGWCAQGPVELYSGDGKHTIVRPSQENGGHVFHMVHRDREFLEQVFASTHGSVAWEPGGDPLESGARSPVRTGADNQR